MGKQTLKAPSNRDFGSGFMAAVVPLLREYTDKLNRAADDDLRVHDPDPPSAAERERLWRDIKRGELIRLHERITAPVDDLRRRVSQMIEHGALDSELDRVELKLRLTDLELTLRRVNDAVLLATGAPLEMLSQD